MTPQRRVRHGMSIAVPWSKQRRHIVGDVVQRPGMETDMLNYAIIFFIIAIIAAVLGFGGIAAGAAEIAKILFFVFLALFLVSLVVGFIKR